MRYSLKYILLLSIFALTSCYREPSDYPALLNEEKSFLHDIYPQAEEKIQNANIKNDQRLNFTKEYEVTWLGIHVGDLFVKIKSEEHDGELFSHMQVIIRSYGLARRISGYQSDTKALIKYKGEGVYVPHKYSTSFALRKKRRDITLLYNNDGSEIIKETNIPPEKRWKRKEVTPEKKLNTYDPLTLSLIAREKLIEAEKAGKKKFTINLYDGRRRTDFEFKIEGYKKKEKLINITFTEIPVSGYTDNELKKIKNQKPIIRLFVSQKDYLPVFAEGKSSFGTAIIKLKDE